MKFSTKSRYALRLMAELARYAPGTTVSLKEISERQNLSLKYLEQIVTPLARVGLVKSERGERQGEALLGHGALVGHAAKARNGRYAALDGAQDLAGGVVGRVFCQAVAALTAPLALDQPHPRQRGGFSFAKSE